MGKTSNCTARIFCCRMFSFKKKKILDEKNKEGKIENRIKLLAFNWKKEKKQIVCRVWGFMEGGMIEYWVDIVIEICFFFTSTVINTYRWVHEQSQMLELLHVAYTYSFLHLETELSSAIVYSLCRQQFFLSLN